MTHEQRSKLEEMAQAHADGPFRQAQNRFMAGAQAAWEMREAEIDRLRFAIQEHEVAAEQQSQEIAEAVRVATLAERERCAKLATDCGVPHDLIYFILHPEAKEQK